MFRTCCSLGCAIAVLTIAADFNPLLAQTAKAVPAKTVPANAAQGGINRLYEDLDYIFGLAKEPDALAELKATLKVFFAGVDPKVPAVFQLYVRKGKFNVVLHAPTTPTPVPFRNNLRALGIKPRQLGAGSFILSGLFNGYLKEGGNVSIIAEDRVDAVPLPGGLAAFKTTLSPQDYDFVADIKNDVAQQKDRKDAIDELRKQVLPGLKKLKNETEAQFELRKLTIDQQLTEIKQIYGEADNIFSYVDLVPAKKTFISSTDLTALPATDLAKAIDELAKEPSYFANIPLSDKEPLSAMLNLKLDAMRQKHVQNFLVQFRPLVQTGIKDSETNSAKTKEYARISTDIIFDVLDESAKTGVFDSFLNVQANASGIHTLVGGTRVDGAVVKASLQKLKDAAKVELDTGKVGDVELHKVTLPEDLTELHKIFGKELVLILGTSPKAVWYALGENSEAKLKEAIEKAAQPAPAANNVIVHLHGKALLWMELFDAHRTKHKKGESDARKRALDAFKTGDTFEFKMEKSGGKLSTTLTLHEGFLHLFGKIGARFVKENLQN